MSNTDYAKKFVSVKKNREFQYLFKKGKSIVNGAFVCYFRPNKRRVNRLGIVTSKKIGNAVKRSRARRVIREAFRLLEPELRQRCQQRHDFVFVARGKTPYLKSTKIYSVMRSLILEKLGS
ncbi:MAG: ribonuclease P protein component [Oscillospiraceae bacterium]|nr:ribonuclease P protein component [Oscillospiraceae bacterium]